MQYFMLAAFVLAVAASMPFDVVEDEDGQEYYLVPINREKRDTHWGASDRGATVSHQGNVVNNDNHRLGGGVSASKNWGSHGLRPDQVGGHAGYSHKPSGSSAFVGAERTRNYGTDVHAGASYNLHQGKNWGADVSGQYGRHFGGPGGTGRPSSGASLNVHGKF